MPTETNIEQLVINKLTQAKYDELDAAGQVLLDQLYLITDGETNAINVIYNNEKTKLKATNVQDAIDEINAKIGSGSQTAVLYTPMVPDLTLEQKNQARKNIGASPYAGYVTPQMYGAKGDGKTDDSVAFQAMLNATEYNRLIFVPNGTYIVKNLELKNQCRMWGVGYRSVLLLPSDAKNNDFIMHEASGSYGYSFLRDIVLDGNKANIGQSVVCNGYTNSGGYRKYSSVFENIVFRNFTGSGMYCENHAMEYVINNCRFRDNDKYGAYLPDFMDSKISNCNFSGNHIGGLYIAGSTVKMVNSKCFMNGTSSEGFGLYVSGIHHTISNIEAQENYYDGIYFDRVDNLLFGNSSVNNNTHKNCSEGAQVRVKDCKNSNLQFGISGGWMKENPEPIVEKYGLTEVGANNVNNIYDIQVGGKLTQMKLLKTEYRNIGNSYIFNGERFFEQDAKMIDLSKARCNASYANEPSVEKLGMFDISAKGKAKGAAANVPILQISIADFLTEDDKKGIKAGDKFYATAWVKRTKILDGEPTLKIKAQEIVEGNYLNLTSQMFVESISTEYTKVEYVGSVPNGNPETGKYNIQLYVVEASPKKIISAGTDLALYIKNLQFKIERAGDIRNDI